MATHSSILAWRIPGTGAAWWAAVYGVTQSRTRLKRLSSSSSSSIISSVLSHIVYLFDVVYESLLEIFCPTWSTDQLHVGLQRKQRPGG